MTLWVVTEAGRAPPPPPHHWAASPLSREGAGLPQFLQLGTETQTTRQRAKKVQKALVHVGRRRKVVMKKAACLLWVFLPESWQPKTPFSLINLFHSWTIQFRLHVLQVVTFPGRFIAIARAAMCFRVEGLNLLAPWTSTVTLLLMTCWSTGQAKSLPQNPETTFPPWVT